MYRAVVVATLLAACGSARPAAMRGPSDNDLEAHADALRERLAGQGFTVVVEHPFVVIGDEPPARVRRRAATTIRWAVDRLETEFFQRSPRKLVEIWIFRNERAYRRGAARLFGDRPDTPFGYYAAEDGAIILNIDRGSGTLVHELVHPYIESDFPLAPVWFNEGLASLFEKPGERSGRIVGRNNWRLANLQREIEWGILPPIDALLSIKTDDFYDAEFDSYAYARYLMMYLQEQGVLVEFYKRFKTAARRDPTGRATLLQVLGVRDMRTLQRRWSSWVLALAP